MAAGVAEGADGDDVEAGGDGAGSFSPQEMSTVALTMAAMSESFLESPNFNPPIRDLVVKPV